MTLPTVSIVIPTYNSERTLRDCLESIKKQDYPKDKVEVIIVDNNSNDRTPKIAKNYGAKPIIKDCGRSEARNLGVDRSKGKYILYLDSDMYLSEKLISECVNALENNKEKVALYIPERIIGQGCWIKVRDFERSFYNATCIDAVRFLRKDKFLQINGFDKNLIGGEDWDLDRRIKGLGGVSIITSPLFHDEGNFELKKYLGKKSYYAGTLNNYIEKWGKNDTIIKKQLGAYYRLFGVFTEKGKWKNVITHPLMLFSMYFFRIVIGIQYLKTKMTSD